MKLDFLRRFFVLILLITSVTLSVTAKDTWISVKSKNFFLIGNANEKEIRGVATKLEQFRETFRQVFSRLSLNQSIQTNVVVFKSGSAYNPFRPKLANGKPDTGIAGYFQPGPDVNYITLSTEYGKEDTYGTIFHEYVHFIVNTNMGRDIPPWFNEGVAEYYQTFKIEEDQKVSLGYPQMVHLQLLSENKLIPLKTFFEIDHYSLHQNGNHSRSIFYAQAWALIHYLLQGNPQAGKQLDAFVGQIQNGAEAEAAFQKSFSIDYATMEKNLRKYVEQARFNYSTLIFKNKLTFDTEMTTAPLTEAEANAYLGDLLYHSGEYDNAEVYLKKSIALDPDSSLANTAYGLVKMRQRKFDEAKAYLEKATSSGSANYLAYYNYAYVLSRESMDQFNYVTSYPKEAAEKMRAALKKAIELNPNFSESYSLFSFISYVNNENLDEALKYLQIGQKLQPGNQEYALHAAQIFMRQEKFNEAKTIAEKLAKNARDEWIKSSAASMLKSISSYEEWKSKSASGQPGQVVSGARRVTKSLTQEELAKAQEEININSLNRQLSQLKPDEKRVLGNIQKISCVNGSINYAVKSGNETLQLKSKNFNSIEFNTFIPNTEGLQIGCDAKLQQFLVAVTYRPSKSGTGGDLLNINFMPTNFKLRSAEELVKSEAEIDALTGEQSSPPPGSKGDNFESSADFIKRSLRQPNPDEKRELATLEKMECAGRTLIFTFKSDTGTIKIKTSSPEKLRITAYTSEVGNFKMGCNLTFTDVFTVVTYKPAADGKSDSELIALELVPKEFKL